MSDISPKPVKGGNADQQKQIKMLAVLGLVFVLVLVFMVVKPFGGGDTSAPPAPAAVTAEVPGAPAVATAPVPGGPAAAPAEAVAPAPPPARPSRTPFDPPR